MKIGLTYDLRADYLAAGFGEEETAEFDSEITIAAICGALEALGHEPIRIGNVKRLAERLVAGERWDAVFFLDLDGTVFEKSAGLQKINEVFFS